MADPFLAEIRIFPFNYPPTGWAWCDGQVLPISQNQALFELLGTAYGGTGDTFALPDLRGRAPMHPGQGPGLSPRALGESGGAAAVALDDAEIPSHTHAVLGVNAPGNAQFPAPNVGLARATGGDAYAASPDGSTVTPLDPSTIDYVGADQAHENMMPFLTLYFCIALQGVPPQA